MGTTDVVVSRLWAGDRGAPALGPTGTPTLSWSVTTARGEWRQASAEVEVRRGEEVVLVHLDGAASQKVPWPVPPLDAYTSVQLRVRVTGTDGSASEFSDWLEVRTGFLSPADWAASFIGAAQEVPDHRPVRFRTVVAAPAGLRSATLSVTAHGVYEALVGGRVVGDEVLAPGWTPFTEVLTVQSHDVTALLTPGAPAVVGVTVAEGWYGESFGFGYAERPWDGPPLLSAQLRMVDEDGTVTTVVTDASWRATIEGPVLAASIYDGEVHDARREDEALDDPDVPLPGALPAVLVDADVHRLVPASAPPIRTHEELAVRAVSLSPSGRTILDFGQNLVGRLRLRVPAAEGATITLRHAEVLEDGELCVRPLRRARATDTLTVGPRAADWSPRFTVHGFRYAEVTGWPRELDPALITAVVVHNDMVRTGYLSTGDADLDQLHSNVVWSMRGNFLALPTDCPQRDERMGWTGDIQVFAPTAGYLYDTAGFLGSWLRDLAAEQRRRGGVVPFVVPDPFPRRAPADGGLGRRGDHRPVGPVERSSPTPRRSVGSTRACATGSRWSGRARRATCGPAASSSATGSIPPPRRRTPRGPAPTRTSSPARTTTARRRSSRRPPPCWGRGTTRRSTAPWPSASGRPSSRSSSARRAG